MKSEKALGIAAKLLLSGLAALALTGVFAAAVANFARYRRMAAARPTAPAGPATTPAAAVKKTPGPLDATYLVDGEPVTLVGGEWTAPAAPGAASAERIRVFSVAAHGDLDGDGAPDAAVLLTKDAGGSGTFFYVAAALARDGRYEGTNAVLLGDRVAPDTTSIQDGLLTHNYADREAGAPMTAQPSQGKSIYLRYQDGALREVPPPQH